MDEKAAKRQEIFLFHYHSRMFLLGYILFLTFRFEDAILYLGEKPYQWSENPSTWFNDELSWFRIASTAAVAVGLGRLISRRIRSWSLSDSKQAAWIFFHHGRDFAG